MKVGLPAGIGDFSWAWSKLCHVQENIESLKVCDGWPHRTVPYVAACISETSARLEGRTNVPIGFEVGYGDFNYQTIQLFTKSNGISNPTWADLHRDFNRHGVVLLEPNEHLELGRRLEDWMPDLPTNFHYPLYTEWAFDDATRKLLRVLEDRELHDVGPLVGISCASYRGSEAWKTWGFAEWRDILGRMVSRGWTPVILGGFWDDLSYSLACDMNLPDLVGKTTVAECVEILRMLSAYVGFSSGLNVIRTVVDKPAFALWPDHQVELATSWVPPDMLENRRYSWSLWRDPEVVWPTIKAFLERCQEEEADAEGTRRQTQAGSLR